MHIKPHKISVEKLTFRNIYSILKENFKIELSKDSIDRINKCRTYLDNQIACSEEPLYGINTGFGDSGFTKIKPEDLVELQKNLIKSCAAVQGDIVPERVVKIMLLLKIQSLSYGHSGVQLATVQRLVDLYNNNIIPVIYQSGYSLTSGDLNPLANLSLPLLGLGEVFFEGNRISTDEVNFKFGWQPILLKAKEASALLNGTQFMCAYAVSSMLKTFRISELSDIISTISLDIFNCSLEPFHELIQAVRHHKGQIQTAETINMLIEGSEMMKQPVQQLEDPDSFKCIPQVHGASKDAINYISHVFLNEINSVTDNPTIFPEDKQILDGGNYHGQPLAVSLCFLAIALSELGNISARRTYQLISGKRGLPSFLATNPELNFGLTLPPDIASSIVNQNKMLCTPDFDASDESLHQLKDNDDRGVNIAAKAYKVVENVERILAIELFSAAQALEYRRPKKSSAFIEKFIERYRTYVPFDHNDKILNTEINKTVEFLRTVEFHIPDELVDPVDNENDELSGSKKSWIERLARFKL